MQDLAQMLASHPRWRWIEGARTRGNEVVIFQFNDELTLCSTRGVVRKAPGSALVPDLGDPGTWGAMLRLLQESADGWTVTRRTPAGWFIAAHGDGPSLSSQEPPMDLGDLLARTLLAIWAR